MLHRLRSVLVMLSVSLSGPAMGQIPSEVQKVQGFAGGGSTAGGLDIEGIDSIRGAPWLTPDVLWTAEYSGVWRRAGEFTGTGGTVGIGKRFGWALAMDGDYCVVGAPFDDVNGIDEAGSAYFFVLDRQSQAWIQLQRIVASDGAAADHFGNAVAMDGGTIAVAAVGRGDPGHGGVYIFELIDGVWTETQFLLPGNLTDDDRRFGDAIALDGDRMVVGASRFDSSGRAFVYHRDENGIWQQAAVLVGPGDPDEDFGEAVALRGDLIAVGASHSGGENEIGAFRVFRFNGSSWRGEAHEFQVPPDILDGLGISVAIADSGDVIFVGSREAEFFKGGVGDGNIRVFRYDPNEQEWFETELFRPSDQIPGTEQAFGWNIAVDGDWLVSGAPGDGGGSGAVYFYDLTGQLGTRARLMDLTIQFGTYLSGGLSSLTGSEDSRYRIRSQFGFAASEPNLAELRIGATNYVDNPALLNLLIEARITQPGGTMKVRLRNWNTNTLTQVHQYNIGTSETVQQSFDIPAASYIRASDDRVEVSLRSVVFATFSALGFEAQHDFINVLVRE